MKAFIDEHRDQYGVEPICRVLPIAPKTYFAHAAKKVNQDLRLDRAKRDDGLSIEIRRVFDQNFQVYGIRKIWRQMKREGFNIARCAVERLMKAMGLKGVIRGKGIRMTIPDDQAYRPNALWVADFTYVSTLHGFAYVALVADVFARKPIGTGQLIHHSDRGSQ
jgi:putative transposase